MIELNNPPYAQRGEGDREAVEGSATSPVVRASLADNPSTTRPVVPLPKLRLGRI